MFKCKENKISSKNSFWINVLNQSLQSLNYGYSVKLVDDNVILLNTEHELDKDGTSKLKR